MANSVLHTPSRHTFSCDGTQRLFPIPSYIISQDYVRIEIDGVLQSDRKKWDIVNNSLVFIDAPSNGSILDVQVASDSESLGELGMISNVDIVAQNITQVSAVGSNIDDVVNVSNNINTVTEGFVEIKTVADNIASVNTNASNIDDIVTVAGISDKVVDVSEIKTEVSSVAGIKDNVTTVANIESSVVAVTNNETNINEVSSIKTEVATVAGIKDEIVLIKDNLEDVQNASENAINAKLDSYKAEAHKLTANSYAVEPEDTFVKVYTSNGDGTFTATDTTDYSALHWERKASTLVTEGIIDDTTPALDRAYSSSKVQSELQAIEDDIQTINTDIGLIDSRVQTVETDIGLIEDDIQNINTDIGLIDSRVQTIETDISDITGSINTLDGSVVKTTGNQTIYDVKIFDKFIKTPEANPVEPYEVTNKKYVDDNIEAVYDYIDTHSGEATIGAYGFKYNQETNVTERLGATDRIQIQKNMKRCVLNSDGTINYYLDPYDSTKKADGTTAILTGADGNVMVEVPKFWYKHELNGNEHQWWVSPTPLAGYSLHPWFLEGGVEHDFRYYRAYTCINQGGVLRSVSGVTPTRSQTIATFRTQARANGAGWNLCSWNAVNATQLLYLTEYCSFNSQAMIGHGNHNGTDYGITTGQSNVIGNASSGSLNNDMWMSYRGIENFYADCWEFVDGINVQNYKVYLNQNPSTFASDVFTGDYVDSGITVPPASNSFVKKISGNFIPTALGGDSNTFITDAFWSATGNRIVVFGGSAGNGASDGAFCLAVDRASGHSDVTFGAGLSR